MQTIEQTREDRIRHSLPGIIATVIALLNSAAVILLILILVYLDQASPQGIDDESPKAMALGAFLVLTVAGSFVGSVLGFAGLFQKRRRRVFPVFGALINLFILFALIGLTVFGLVTG